MQLRRTILAIALLFVTAFGAVLPPRAQAQGVTLIRDAEIEHTIRSYATPVLQAAGLSPQAIDIYIIQDRSLNAFVIPGNRMFLHTGLLMRAEDPLELIGVIAHEAGHIAGGHIAGRGEELRYASIKAIASLLLGLGAAAASGDGRAAGAVMGMGQDAALRGLLAYTRGQEQAADQAAITYLRRAGLSPEGLRDFMSLLEGQEVLLSSNQDPYLRTHPLSRERVSFLDEAVRNSPYQGEEVPADLREKHERMRAKLVGFIEPSQVVARRYPESDQSLPARYARTIAAHRAARMDEALQQIEALLAEYPQDPYFHELRGQILLENGRAAEAVPAYQQAVSLQPDAAQMRLRLAQAQVELNQSESNRAALSNLEQVLAREPDNASAWRLKAIAQGRQGETGLAALSLAEMHFAEDNWHEARGQADRARRMLPEGSSAWLRASDLAEVAEREEERAERERR
ncbi:M48 family metalloprotease [Aquibaculum sediminis]|uniref:M48 family metalloprotease n=1 Tax=Aquibaculum sediminis TaxID=3231907 RepID=UPI003451619B